MAGLSRSCSGLALLFAMLVSLVASRVNGGDLRATLPTEEELNRYNLTLAWWGQATLDPRRDELQHLTFDEQNVYAQAKSGIVSAFSGETGRRMWSNLIGVPGMETFPAVSNEEELLLSRGLRVFSLDKSTGLIVWELEIPSHPSTSPEVDENRAYIGMTDGSVLAYDLRDIRQLYADGMLPEWTNRARSWRFQGTGEIVSPPISTGDVVAFGSAEGYVYGVTAPDRRLRFQFRSEGGIDTPIGRSQDLIFVVDKNWRMYCVHQKSGVVRWAATMPAPVMQQPRIIGSQVFVNPQRKGLISLSVSGGRQQWDDYQTAVSEFISASDERIYASDAGGNLVMLNRETGAIEGKLNLRHFEVRKANDRTDRIYMATKEGLIIALRERGSEYPAFHLFPDRRPILPELAPEEEAAPTAAN